MQRSVVDLRTGMKRIVDLTPEEIAEDQRQAAARIVERAQQPKVLTMEGVEELFIKAGLSQGDINQAKR